MPAKKDSRFLAPVSLLLVFAASPFLGGCSTFGIAKADDLTAAENRLEAQNRSSNARVTDLEKQLDLLDQTVQKLEADDAGIQAELDSLNTRFKKAREWLMSLDIEDIAGDLETARTEASEAKSGNVELTRRYLARMQEEQEALEAQIESLEALLVSLEGAGKTPPPRGATKPDGEAPKADDASSSGDHQ